MILVLICFLHLPLSHVRRFSSHRKEKKRLAEKATRTPATVNTFYINTDLSFCATAGSYRHVPREFYS